MTNRPLSRATVQAHIAAETRRIEVQQAIAERLDSLADDERREQYRLEGRLAAFRRLADEQGLVDP